MKEDSCHEHRPSHPGDAVSRDELKELVVEGDRVAARLHDTGTPVAEWNGLAPNGATVSFAETAAYQVEDGRFKHMWYLMDVDSLRRQLAA